MQFLVILLGLFSTAYLFENSTKKENIWRIINGVPIPIEKAPYQTSIEHRARHGCGGVIIARDLVLTAAHCLRRKTKYKPSLNDLIAQSPAFLRVRVGHDYTHIGGQVYKVKDWIIHENFNRIPFDSDIAMIRLQMPFKFTPAVQPIEMATEEPKPGEMASVTGFGLTEPKRHLVGPTKAAKKFWDPLLNISIPIIDLEKCKEIMWNAHKGIVTENMLCAGYLDDRIDDSCTGDSGGPMVVNGKLAGLTSWGYGCGREGLPGIYTNVVKFADWIERTKKILHQIPF